MQKVIPVIFIFYFFLFPFFSNTSFAKDTTNASSNSASYSSQAGRKKFLEYAYIINANEKNIKDGSIISYTKQGRVLSNIAYDQEVSGIVSRNVGLILYTNDTHRGLPIISDGIVYVLVSTRNGFIKRGDQITTSTMSGVGVKAIKSGYVVGTALENYDNPDPNHADEIAVDLKLKNFNWIPTFPNFLSGILNIIVLPSPAQLFPYIAIGVILASFILVFLIFHHTSVETINRNPYATHAIHSIIIFNIVMVLLIVLVVFTLSFLLFRL